MSASTAFDPADKFANFLKEEIEANEKATRVWMVLGGILLLVVFGYMTWSYQVIGQLFEPSFLVGMVEATIEEQTPIYKERIEDRLTESAPTVIRNTGESIVREMPAFRQRIEKEIFTFVDYEILKMRRQIDAEFDKGLKKHKEDIRKAAVELMKDPAAADRIAKEMSQTLMDAFHASIDHSTDEGSAALMRESEFALVHINNRLKKIEAGKNLTAEDKKLRHFVQLMWVRVQEMQKVRSR